MNEKFEKYIKDLSPELQEKARQCKTTEELNAFLAVNDLELPEEALEMVSGGGALEELYNWLDANGHITEMKKRIRKKAVQYGLEALNDAPPQIKRYAMYLNAIYDII
ncbi:MAG: hypothetical protein J6O40_05875 [Ruminococcus sp.]|nr:hypothetical protein [Ruminococcus sp.]